MPRPKIDSDDALEFRAAVQRKRAAIHELTDGHQPGREVKEVEDYLAAREEVKDLIDRLSE